jgi:hypothetical protein
MGRMTYPTCRQRQAFLVEINPVEGVPGKLGFDEGDLYFAIARRGFPFLFAPQRREQAASFSLNVTDVTGMTLPAG